jgi:hypothetical protein
MIRRLAQATVVLAALALFAFAWRCDAAWFDKHVFVPQQFFIPASRGIVLWCRTVAATTALLLLALVPFLPRGASGWRLLLAVLLTVPAAELLIRWRVRRLVRPELIAAMDALTISHPRYGRTLTALMDRIQPLSGREIRFRTDAESRRISGAPIDPRAPSLVFTGESTVAGFGLQWEETFPALLGERLRLQVVNLASPAYRSDQSWLRLKDALPTLERPVGVVGIFMPGLVGRSFTPPQAPTPLQGSGLYRLWRHLYWSDAAVQEGMRSVEVDLREMASLARARGIPCIFLVTGHTPPGMVHEMFEVPALQSVVVEVPQEELLADGHPGPRGSIRIADALEARLRTTIANR